MKPIYGVQYTNQQADQAEIVTRMFRSSRGDPHSRFSSPFILNFHPVRSAPDSGRSTGNFDPQLKFTVPKSLPQSGHSSWGPSRYAATAGPIRSVVVDARAQPRQQQVAVGCGATDPTRAEFEHEPHLRTQNPVERTNKHQQTAALHGTIAQIGIGHARPSLRPGRSRSCAAAGSARCPGCRGRCCWAPRPDTQKYHLAASPSASTVSRLGSVLTWRAR